MAKKRRTVKQEKLTDVCPVRKKRERFDGLTEDEVLAKTLPDHLAHDLDIVIVRFISPTQFTPATPTRRDSLVLSLSAV